MQQTPDAYPLAPYHDNTPGNDGFDEYADEDDRRPILTQDPHVQMQSPASANPYFPSQSPPAMSQTGTPAPGAPRRWKTVTKVKLFKGNLVLDCPVPKKLLQMLPRKEEREFTHMRYTPLAFFRLIGHTERTGSIQVFSSNLRSVGIPPEEIYSTPTALPEATTY